VAGHEVDEHLDRVQLKQRRDRRHGESAPSGRIDEDEREASRAARLDEGDDGGDVILELAVYGVDRCVSDRICECLQSRVRAVVLFDEEASELDLSAGLRVCLTSFPKFPECNREGSVA